VLSFALRIHSALVPLILVLAGLALLAGLSLYLLSRNTPEQTLVSGNLALARRVFRGLLAALAGIGVLQALFGLLLVAQGDQPREGLHFVYGIIVAAAVPVAYVYSDQKQVRRDVLVLTVAVAAVVGAALRAVATGPR
jgi:hypothetical protein